MTDDDEIRDFARKLFAPHEEPAPKPPTDPDAEMRDYARALFHDDTEEN